MKQKEAERQRLAELKKAQPSKPNLLVPGGGKQTMMVPGTNIRKSSNRSDLD
jgi:hypothetical protein